MQQNLPKHVTATPDGSRRWAKLHGLPTIMGHLEGRERFHEISKIVFDLGIPYFTFWAMSEDNLNKRGVAEIDYLISLMQESLQSRMANDLLKNQIRFRVLGRWRSISRYGCLAPLIDDLENRTRLFEKHNLTIMLGYDGGNELVEMIQNNLYLWYQRVFVEPCGSYPDFETIRQASWAGILPPVDLEIRTGETMENWFHNSSGFMMLHTANSEIRLSQTLWPDFSAEEFKKIMAEYGQREHKLGA